MAYYDPTAGPDQRHASRFRVTRARLTGHNIEALLVDFSTHGMGLETHVGLRIGATYSFRLFGGRGRPIAASVRWCRLWATDRRANGDVRPVYRAGLTLAKIRSGPQPFDRWPRSESPISTPDGKYSRQRRSTRAATSGEQNSSSGKPGLSRASMTTGMP